MIRRQTYEAVEAQILANERKKSCSCVYFRPGRVISVVLDFSSEVCQAFQANLRPLSPMSENQEMKKAVRE